MPCPILQKSENEKRRILQIVAPQDFGVCFFFGYLGFFKLLGRSEFALRRGFAFGKTLERRKSGAAQKGRWARCRKPIENLKYLDCSDLPKQKDILSDVLLFWALTAKGGLHPSGFQCSGRQSRPCAKVFTCGENACTAHSRRRPEGRVGAVLSACREFENIQIVVTSQKKRTSEGISPIGAQCEPMGLMLCMGQIIENRPADGWHP